MSWLTLRGDGSALLSLHIQPGASRTEIAGLHGDALKIRLAAPPVDGKANAALLAFIADTLDLPKRAVTLESGASSRQKRVRVEGADPVRLASLAPV
ncbi:hypothetical protein GGR36_002560 [Niveibacterium umoris]|uniref:UPF0235 protein GGR36_002560 n=1 Tax=Niveibacterium umoris TaxID=1193620 RepID=A0A840BL84_9RHOO|nr:hypothetical protein [Niveibacterium umoris]